MSTTLRSRHAGGRPQRRDPDLERWLPDPAWPVPPRGWQLWAVSTPVRNSAAAQRSAPVVDVLRPPALAGAGLAADSAVEERPSVDDLPVVDLEHGSFTLPTRPGPAPERVDLLAPTRRQGEGLPAGTGLAFALILGLVGLGSLVGGLTGGLIVMGVSTLLAASAALVRGRLVLAPVGGRRGAGLLLGAAATALIVGSIDTASSRPGLDDVPVPVSSLLGTTAPAPVAPAPVAPVAPVAPTPSAAAAPRSPERVPAATATGLDLVPPLTISPDALRPGARPSVPAPAAEAQGSVAKPSPAKPNPPKSNPAKGNSAKGNAAKTSGAKTSGAKTSGAKTTSAKTTGSKSDPARSSAGAGTSRGTAASGGPASAKAGPKASSKPAPSRAGTDRRADPLRNARSVPTALAVAWHPVGPAAQQTTVRA